MPKICNKEGCNNNVFGKGYCKNHQYLRPKTEVKESKLHLYVKPDSRDALQIVEPKKDVYALDKWFKARRLEMTGKCMECSKKTAKDIHHLYKFSICHIVPKSPTNGCPSVATNEHNWIELCIDHHAEFDNTFERAMKMKVWEIAKLKAQMFLHLIPRSEYKKFLDHFNK